MVVQKSGVCEQCGAVCEQFGAVWGSVGANNVFASRACSKKDTNSNSVHFGG